MRRRYPTTTMLLSALQVLGLLALPPSVAGQGATAPAAALPSAATADADIEQVRAYYFQQDFDGSAMVAEELLRRAPDDVEAHAWYVISMSRNSMTAAARAAGDALLERWPDHFMSHIAKAFVYNYATRDTAVSLAAAEHAAALRPDDPWAIWAKGLMLLSAGRRADAVAYLDDRLSAAAGLPEILSVRANAIMLQGTGTEGDPALLDAGLAAFAEVRRLHPDNLSAWFFPGTALINQRRLDEGLPLLERAAALAPQSVSVQQRYWAALASRRDLTAEEKKAIIVADADRILELRGHRPAALSSLANTYREHGVTDRLEEVESRVLRDFNDSPQAEWVLTNRYRALSQRLSQPGAADTVDVRAEFRRQVWDFIQRPHHHNEAVLGDAYLTMLHSAQGEDDFPAADLLRVVQGVAQYNRINPGTTHTTGPIALADRGVHLEEAEAVVRAGFTHVDEYMERNAAFYRTVGEAADTQDRLYALHHDALGWVFYRQGRLDEARQEVERAVELSRELPLAHYHLGRMAEDLGDLDQAELHYARGRGFETFGRRYNGPALRALYEKKHGSLDGFEEFAAGLDEKDRLRRRTRIAESRIEDPQPVPVFDLELLHGGTYDFENMRGRIGVINFWGVWCGPCVKEAPDMQKLHEKYRDDPDVVFITIDNDPNPDTVREFMATREFDFPVLLDDGYVTRSGVRAFPTTWFIDRDGRIVFQHLGASDVVFEEFVWRVDLLKGVVLQARK
jgi:tetratricopeptide (TPR) repeat protein/thiol-disulfide isomerase/thioredoxin